MQKISSYIKSHKAESIISGIVLVALMGAAGYLVLPKIKFSFPHKKIVKTQITSISPDQAIQQKNADMIASVGKEIKLPTDEQPILATVSDKNQLQNQDFFKQAQDGDKILLYPKNKKAFLYRPSINHVIAQAPLIYQNTPPDASVAAEATATAQQDPIQTIKPQGKVLYNNQ